MAVYCLIFELWFNLLPVRRRKSRSSSTFISSCAIRLSFSSSAVIGRLRGRPFVFCRFPCLTFCLFRLWRFINPLICLRVNPKCSAVLRFVIPSSFIQNTSGSVFYLCALPWHNKSLLWFLLDHRRVFLSLSVFTGSVHFAIIQSCISPRRRRRSSLCAWIFFYSQGFHTMQRRARFCYAPPESSTPRPFL